MFLGLRTVIYPAPDLAASKAWYASILGIDPYFDQSFYVGFSVAGYELGLDPAADPDEGPVTYWGVPDVDAAMASLLAAGATAVGSVNSVGDGIRTATVRDPAGSLVGIIENPHFSPGSPGSSSDGPGR